MIREITSTDGVHPMPRAAPAIAATAVLLAVGGCSSTAAPQPFSVPAATSAPATKVVLTPTEEELFGPRVELPGGLLLKQIGKVAQWGGPDDTDSSTFGLRMVIDKIVVDPKCDPYMTKPDRGHRLVLSIRVETSELFQQADGLPQYYQWSTIGPDGVTEGPASSTQDCHSATALPQEMRASAKYRGEVTIETSNPRGQAVLEDFAAWTYPAG
jgi:hypothetical protein